MLDFIPIRAVACGQALSGLAIAGFWISFFTSRQDFSKMPEGYLLHEKSFVWPDSLIAILLFISAGLLWVGNPLGERLSLVAGGMLLFLGIIDIAYEVANGMYKPPRGSLASFISTTLMIAVVALAIVIRFL